MFSGSALWARFFVLVFRVIWFLGITCFRLFVLGSCRGTSCVMMIPLEIKLATLAVLGCVLAPMFGLVFVLRFVMLFFIWW